jgi:hypothetical protein
MPIVKFNIYLIIPLTDLSLKIIKNKNGTIKQP